MIVNNAKIISEAEMSQTLEEMKASDQKIIEKSQKNAERYEELSKRASVIKKQNEEYLEEIKKLEFDIEIL